MRRWPVVVLVLAAPAVASPAAVLSRGSSIVAETLKAPTAYARLSVLTDTIGNRLSGSAAEAKAVAWARA